MALNDVWYFVCGLFTPKDAPSAWNNQAQSWAVRNGVVPAGQASGFTYFNSAAGALINDPAQARMIAGDLEEFRGLGLRLLIAGHSNGAKILLSTLMQRPQLFISELHLIGAAVPNDCELSGLNQVADRRQVGKVVLYVSSADEVLDLGAATGFGNLGKVGPTNVSAQLARIMAVIYARPPCKHSDWVGRDFEQTMRLVTGGDQ